MSTTLTKGTHDIALPLSGLEDLDNLMDAIGDKRYALLGEASHGTHEYYTWRAEISKRLIQEKGFSFIAVEGDWPDCYRVNRYVKGYEDSGESAYDVLHAFNRWPTWMWANTEVVELVEWLRSYNEKLGDDEKIGFYGLDVYSLWDSLYAIIDYLEEHDPQAVQAAYNAFKCFEPYDEDVQEYARATAFVPTSCEDEVVKLLSEIRMNQQEYSNDGKEARFNAEQNAYVLKGAEEYYRTMVYGGADSWNLRDTHMTDTLDRLMKFHDSDAKGIVWAHNTHIGDARYTSMEDRGEYNIGQLVRGRHAKDGVQLVGFGSYEGAVIAGRAWDAPMEEMIVPPAVEGSIEDRLHQASAQDRMFIFSDSQQYSEEFLRPLGHRAIGVVYNPDFEYGNYVPSIVPKRYDAFLYIDRTHALSPIHMKPKPDKDLPETYPYSAGSGSGG